MNWLRNKMREIGERSLISIWRQYWRQSMFFLTLAASSQIRTELGTWIWLVAIIALVLPLTMLGLCIWLACMDNNLLGWFVLVVMLSADLERLKFYQEFAERPLGDTLDKIRLRFKKTAEKSA